MKLTLKTKHRIMTKRTIINVVFAAALVSCALSSCKKDNDTGVTSYTFINKINLDLVNQIMHENYDVDVMLYEYTSSDALNDSNFIDSPTFKKEYLFYPAEGSHHVKLKLISAENTHRWGKEIFYLKTDKNIDIEATTTMLTSASGYSDTEPRP